VAVGVRRTGCTEFRRRSGLERVASRPRRESISRRWRWCWLIFFLVRIDHRSPCLSSASSHLTDHRTRLDHVVLEIVLASISSRFLAHPARTRRNSDILAWVNIPISLALSIHVGSLLVHLDVRVDLRLCLQPCRSNGTARRADLLGLDDGGGGATGMHRGFRCRRGG
jgi:hypothetical protein